ncbi:MULTISPECIES: glycosyltransferase family 25 protein [unclassified Acinetobacter]|uniref:glycosyltransferase family 25 protein n=1 Tax=unclassified Acinetobacter TaxID=196816 RepID=UPI0035B96A19
MSFRPSKNYVISLRSATERRCHISQEFTQQGIDFTFFDAVEPPQIAQLAEKFSMTLSDDIDLTKGEIACLLSHVSLWQKAIDDQLDYIAIFEDDIYLGTDAKQFLQNDEWIKPDIDVIKLEMFDSYKDMRVFAREDIYNRQLRRLQDIHLGAAGYILSRKACQHLVNMIKQAEYIKPSDHIIFEDYLLENHRVYQMSPALCIQSDRLGKTDKIVFQSSLEKNRQQRFEKTALAIKANLIFKNKMQRELKRIIYQCTHLFSKIKVLMFCKINFK